MNIEINPFLISIKLSIVTSIVLFIISFPFACLISFKQFRLKTVIESLVTLPSVLPPTVLGFYLLLLLSPDFYIGKIIYELFNINILFSFTGIVLASSIYSFPHMVIPLKNGLDSIDRALIEASYTLGKSRMETMFKVIVPNIKTSIYSALITTFAHTMGGFGVVLMVGGNIPGVTRVASIAIFEGVEELNFAKAHMYSGILITISFIVLIVLHMLNNRLVKRSTV